MPGHPREFSLGSNARVYLAKASRIGLCICLIAVFAGLLSGVNLAQRIALPAQALPPTIAFQQIAGGLSLPVVITHAGDSSGRLFIVEQSGKTRILQNGSLLPTAFLDITSQIEAGGEKGLLGLAFHPNYASNRRFFVDYTVRVSGQLKTRIAEYAAMVGIPNQADPNSERIILEFDQPFDNHNAGDIKFGPDGYLYITSGDGGSGGDPQNNGQSLNTLLGKILRIDINNGPPFSTPYAIPPTNPFVDGNPDTKDEIWSYGWRNPWRFSFDRLTGDMFVGDVGQSSWEEVDHEPAGTGGRNYGWRVMEGTHCFNPSTGCDMTGKTLPFFEYSHSLGCSVTGGYRYRGSHFTALYGYYLHSDYCTGRIWGSSFSTGWTTTEIVDTSFSVSTFGEDEVGEMYLANYGSGAIYRIVPVNTTTLFRVERAWGHVYTDGAYFCGQGTPGPVTPPAAPCFNAGLGADIAERINSLELLEPGEVVEIDPDHPGYFRRSRGSNLVAGVVSTRPGIVMANRVTTGDTRISIALVGRVPVKASTENGSIQPGDLLTGSVRKPGYAMRCNAPCSTPVIGKALGELHTREGFVLMLVMRP